MMRGTGKAELAKYHGVEAMEYGGGKVKKFHSDSSCFTMCEDETGEVRVEVESRSAATEPRRISFGIGKDEVEGWTLQNSFDKGLNESETRDLHVYLAGVLDQRRLMEADRWSIC